MEGSVDLPHVRLVLGEELPHLAGLDEKSVDS
jgi:hypothetical protein